MGKSKKLKSKFMKAKKQKGNNQSFEQRILSTIKTAQKSPLPYRQLLRACKVSDREFPAFTRVLENMKRDRKITETDKGFVINSGEVVNCVISRLNKTFGFAKIKASAEGEEIFIPGRDLMGAMPEDVVAVRITKKAHNGEKAEGQVVRIIEEGFTKFTGNIAYDEGKIKVIPDSLSKYAMRFDNPLGIPLEIGDKVMCQITQRGNRHSDHRCEVTENFGSSQKAAVCALSVLELEGVSTEFSEAVLQNAKEVCDESQIEKEAKSRLDLRDKLIFTIDGADTKDIDDAVSVEKTENGFLLGVHIADVSFYVRPKSELDNEAFARGTSVYFANKVIPMLPKELSNGICSLNEGEDRLAFSALIELSEEGEILSYRFEKTVIRSRIKGVYMELNDIKSGVADEATLKKYECVMAVLPIMEKLSEILRQNKLNRGAPQLETAESKLVIDENERCIDVIPRQRGFYEELIEDFMLVANECAARFGEENKLCFVYRIHEDPAEDKIDNLCQTLSILGVEIPPHKSGILKPAHMSEILRNSKDTDKALVINNLVLRSMAKAKYSVEPIGHYGLVLSDYAHFTSPIRRYPDLTIHRIMSEFLENKSSSETNRKFQKFANASAEHSTDAEIRAMRIERGCEDCYKAEYMSAFIGEEFDGVICSVMDFGVFVTLENTCEGLVKIESMGDGSYDVTEGLSIRNSNTGVKYEVGQKVRVKVAACNVSAGEVDFELI